MQELIFLELAAVQRTRELCMWCSEDDELMQKQKDFLNRIRVKLNAMQGALISEEEPPIE